MENKCTFLRNAGIEHWANNVPVPTNGLPFSKQVRRGLRVGEGRNRIRGAHTFHVLPILRKQYGNKIKWTLFHPHTVYTYVCTCMCTWISLNKTDTTGSP